MTHPTPSPGAEPYTDEKLAHYIEESKLYAAISASPIRLLATITALKEQVARLDVDLQDSHAFERLKDSTIERLQKEVAELRRIRARPPENRPCPGCGVAEGMKHVDCCLNTDGQLESLATRLLQNNEDVTYEIAYALRKAIERGRDEAATTLQQQADRIKALEVALKRAQHYMGNCGVDIERDYPEIVAALSGTVSPAPQDSRRDERE